MKIEKKIKTIYMLNKYTREMCQIVQDVGKLMCRIEEVPL